MSYQSISEWREMKLRNAGVWLIDCDRRTPPSAEEGYPYVAIPQLKQVHLDLSRNDAVGAIKRLEPSTKSPE
jgi:type I restriction enzyme S subunit